MTLDARWTGFDHANSFVPIRSRLDLVGLTKSNPNADLARARPAPEGPVFRVIAGMTRMLLSCTTARNHVREVTAQYYLHDNVSPIFFLLFCRLISPYVTAWINSRYVVRARPSFLRPSGSTDLTLSRGALASSTTLFHYLAIDVLSRYPTGSWFAKKKKRGMFWLFSRTSVLHDFILWLLQSTRDTTGMTEGANFARTNLRLLALVWLSCAISCEVLAAALPIPTADFTYGDLVAADPESLVSTYLVSRSLTSNFSLRERKREKREVACELDDFNNYVSSWTMD